MPDVAEDTGEGMKQRLNKPGHEKNISNVMVEE
jgi:hypothetical protein